MSPTRIIPCLLMDDSRLVKTRGFSKPSYIGDPVNTAAIFNEFATDEILLLDIGASAGRYRPDFEFLSVIAEQCMVPFGYGGGLRNVEDILAVMRLGAEKVVLNSALSQPDLIQRAAAAVGTQAVVASIDVRPAAEPSNWTCYVEGGRRPLGMDAVSAARQAEANGAGEILLHAIHREGGMQGYDIELIRTVTEAVSVPVIACGGAGERADFAKAAQAGASAVAAGSLFVYQNRKTRSVLINFPAPNERKEILP